MKVIRRYGRGSILLVALLVSTLYIAQLASAWNAEFVQMELDTARPVASLSTSRGSQVVDLTGMGVARGASGVIRFGPRDTIGQLRVQNLPGLPDSEVYKLWCTDMSGTVDEAAVFSNPFDSEGITVVVVAAPRLLYTYPRFQISIESIGSGDILSGTVVMSN